MRLPIWFIVLVFAGVLLIGLICLPLYLFVPWEDIFGEGGVADWLLNIFTYGLLFFLIILPVGLMGLALILQPRDKAKPARRDVQAKAARYSLWKCAAGVLFVWFAYAISREAISSDPPFPTSHADAARRNAQD